MKKIIVLIAIAAIVAGCKKSEQEYCWRCFTVVHDSAGSSTWLVSNEQSEVCEKTESEINSIIKQTEDRGTRTYYVLGHERKRSTKMTCGKK